MMFVADSAMPNADNFLAAFFTSDAGVDQGLGTAVGSGDQKKKKQRTQGSVASPDAVTLVDELD